MKPIMSPVAVASGGGAGLMRRVGLLMIYRCVAGGLPGVAQSQSKAVEPTEALRKLLLMPAMLPRTASATGLEGTL